MNFNLAGPASTFTKCIDVSVLPATHVDKGSKLLGGFLMVFALLWGGTPATAVSSGQVGPASLFVLVFVAIGVAIFVAGLNMFFSSTTIVIDVHGINVTKKSLFGTRQWAERLDAYEGVLSRSEYHPGSKNSPSYTLYIVEMKHRERAKTVRLYESRSDIGFRAVWEDYCRQLNMPAVEMDGSRTVKRGAADLDKSVRDLVKEGKLKVEFDPTGRPPPQLSLRIDGDVLELTVVRKRMTSITGLLILLAVPAAMALIGFGVIGFLGKSVPVGVGVAGAVLFVLFLAFGIWSILTREQIRIGREWVETRQLTPWGANEGEKVASSEIETVRIGTEDGRGSDAVLLETDAGIVSIGEGLSPESMEWLKNCIMRVISA
jgi:hypothetical protein